MQWPMKVLLKGKLTIIAIAVSVGILCLSLMKITVYEPIDLQHIDKLQHSLAYFILSTSWLFALQKKTKKIDVLLAILGIDKKKFKLIIIWIEIGNPFSSLFSCTSNRIIKLFKLQFYFPFLS